MALGLTYPVRSPQWVLTYQGRDITADVSQMVTAISYVDRLGGAAGEIEVQLADSDKRWQGLWFPRAGDLVNLLVGYRNERLLPCGDFQVDDLELTGPPDSLHLRCLAAWITPAVRTLNNASFENATAIQVAQTIASKYGLTIVGASDGPNPAYARITQKNESDLHFLERLATTNGYEFTIRGTQLIFYSYQTLESQPPVATLQRSDLISFAFRVKTHRIYKAAQVAYLNPATKQLVTQDVAAAKTVAPGDTLKLVSRCENGQQALLRAQSALHKANKVRAVARLTMPGATEICAGNNVVLAGFGANDGIYIVETARHCLTQTNGYTSDAELRRLV